MIGKIIVLLPCYIALVNAGEHWCCSCVSSTEATVQYRNYDDWVGSLEITTLPDWTTLIREPDNDKKDTVRKALNKSGCPSGVVNILLENSHFHNCPDGLKNRLQDGYDIDILRTLAFKSIPEVPALLLPAQRLLLIFDSLPMIVPVPNQPSTV
ncbi:uncharacterized protein LOC126837031 [Adelges cooleyi]|uniref:uncharacterized protein LOC126837031 n=1 Tax=Adelges cooleyi TaxID=133065 RepID=UPI0021806A06|nr:uncharacterized protein LOC126837031 [Adelges cooleyi]